MTVPKIKINSHKAPDYLLSITNIINLLSRGNRPAKHTSDVVRKFKTTS